MSLVEHAEVRVKSGRFAGQIGRITSIYQNWLTREVAYRVIFPGCWPSQSTAGIALNVASFPAKDLEAV